MLHRLLTCLALGLISLTAAAAQEVQPIRVAVAANFAATLRDLGVRYEAATGQTLSISTGSTGALASQIEQGAPFDLFLAADAQRPTALEEQGRAVAGSRRTYARGVLVLWSADPTLITGLEVLRGEGSAHLAITNPATAPYGLAARQALERLGLWPAVQPRLVVAQSIGQTHQFVTSGASQLGFIALSQVQTPGNGPGGSQLLIDPALHDPIEQQVVMLTDSPAVRAFWTWITEDAAALALIRSYGYRVDGPEPGR
jgi:molybdate transport system substrate-binding protein